MGVHFPFVAWLTDAMVLPVGDPVPQGRLIHPRIEPEIVFVMGDRLEGPGVTCAQAMSAVESVWGGAEVIDSRYSDFRFTAGDVAADNASSGAFVTGPIGLPPAELDLALEAVLVEVDGVIVDSATGAAVQGHPGEALALAANDLARRGHAIEAGWIVLTGGMTDAVFAPPGSSTALHFTNLGSVFLNGGKGLTMPLIEVTLVEGRTPAAAAHPDLRAHPRRRRGRRRPGRQHPGRHPRGADHALGRRRRHHRRAPRRTRPPKPTRPRLQRVNP